MAGRRLNPKLRESFEALPIDVKNKVLSMNIPIETQQELDRCVQKISDEKTAVHDISQHPGAY